MLAPKNGDQDGLLGNAKLQPGDEDDSFDDDDDEQTRLSHFPDASTTTSHPSKKRSCCGTIVHTPNSSRYRNNLHSRFIQKFPFLVEMFYWVVNLLAYVGVKAASEVFATEGLWNTAEKHAIHILELEHNSTLSFMFPAREVDVQMFFRTEHPELLTILNRAYSLIHIPVTVRYVIAILLRRT